MAVGKQSFLSQQEDYFDSLFGSTEKKSITANPYGMIAERAAQAKKLAQIEHEYRLKEQFIPAPQEGIIMPDNPITENRQISQAVDVAKKASAELAGQINVGLNDFTRQLGLPADSKLDEPTFVKLMKIKEASSDPKTGVINTELLKKNLAQTGSWWSQTFNPERIKKVFDNPTTDTEVKARDNIYNAATAYEGKKVHDYTITAANNMWNSAVDLAGQDKSMKAVWEKEFKAYGKRGESLDDFIKDVMANQGTVDKNNRFHTVVSKGAGNTLETSEHNIANEVFNRVNKNTNNKLTDLVNKTMITRRYSQEDDKTALGKLTKGINNDIAVGSFKGYGLNGQDGLKWQDINGKVIPIKDPSKISGIKSSYIMTPTGVMLSIVADIKDGKETKTVKTYSDIRPELKPTIALAMKSDAFEIAKTNPALAAQLSNSARLLEDGYASYPDYKYRNSTTNSNNVQMPVSGASTEYNITDNISNDFIGKPVNIRGVEFGLKRLGFGDSQKSVIVAKGTDKNGVRYEKVLKLTNGELSDSPIYYYTDPNDALKELNLFNLKSDDAVKQNVEINENNRRTTTSSSSSSSSQSNTF